MKFLPLIAILFLAAPAAGYAQSNTLPAFNLPDPQGGMHSSAQLSANGLVAIVSAPLLKDKSAQEGWSKALVAAKGNNPASLILLEDMADSAFEGIAASHIKKDWNPGTLPIILEDKTGKVHASFAVGKDQTKVFVYDSGGNLVYSTSDSPSAAGAQTVWGKLAK